MQKVTYLLFALLISAFGFAQCDYTLNISDSFDGAWNGGFLEVNLDGAPAPGSPFTVTAGGGVPQTETFTITVNDGQAIELVYNYSVTDNTNYFDVGYELIDSEGIQVSELVGGAPAPMGVPAAPATLYTGTTACPTCPAVTNVVTSNPTADGGQISWTADATHVSWEVLYGPAGFDPQTAGTLVPASSNPFILTGAPSATNLDIYVRPVCAGNDIGSYRGPESLMTLSTCPEPTDPNLAAVPNAVTSNSVTFFWLDNGNTTTMYQAVYGPPGFDPTVAGAGTTVDFTIVPGFTQYELMGLTPETTYDLYIRANCGMGDFSFYSTTPLNFTTTISCPAPTMLELDAATITDVTVSYLAGAQETEWEVEVGAPGFAPGTGAELGSVLSATTTATVGGITDSTQYDVYVRANCDPGTSNDSSAWVGPLTFTSPCLAFPAPYMQDFENFTVTQNFTNELCFSTTSTTGLNWDVDNAPTPSFGTGPSAAHSGANYMFTESTGATAGDEASLVGATVDLAGLTNPSLDFFYHMYGATVGSLAVDIAVTGQPYDEDVALISGQQQTAEADPFLQRFVDLSAYAGLEITFRFRVTAGGNASGDVAIDTIRIDEAPSCLPVTDLMVANLMSDSADITFNGPSNATGYEYVVQAPGTGVPTMAGTAFAASGETIPGLSPSTSYEVYVRADCGMGDFSDWVGPVAFNTLITGPQGVTCPGMNEVFVFTEEFDIQGSWTGAIAATGNGVWRFGQMGTTTSTATGPDMAGSGSSYAYFEGSGTGTVGSMVSPAIDLTTATDAAELSFLLHAFGDDIQNFEVAVGNAVGGPFTSIFQLPAQLQTGNSDPFQSVGIDLSAYLGQVIYLQFTADSTAGFNSDVALDLLRVQTCGQFCAAPLALDVQGITSDGGSFTWTDGNANPSAGFEVVVVPTGDPSPTGAGTAATSPYPITGLTPVTSYDAYVRADCGNGDFSVYAGPFTFETACAAFPAPYLEDFANATFDNPGVCWDESDNSPLANGPIPGGNGSWTEDDFANDTTNSSAMRVTISGTFALEDWIISPAIDLGTSSWELTYDYALTGSFNTNTATLGSDDQVVVQISDDAGLTWTTLITYDSTSTIGNTGQTEFIDLSAYSGEVIFAVYATNGTMNDPGVDFHIDDFRVDAVTTCLPPVNLTVSNITETSAQFDWTEGGNMPASQDYEVIILPAGSPLPTAAGTPVTGATTYTDTMLTASTSYDFYVRALCSATDISIYEGPLSFSTNIAGPVGANCPNMNPTFVFTEEFDMQGTWTGDIGTGNQQWRFGQAGATGSTGTGPNVPGSGGAYVYYESSGTGTTGAMVSPAIDLTTATDSAELSFLIHAFGADISNFNIGVGNAATGPFTQVFGISSQVQDSNAAPWQAAGVDLTAYLGQVIYLQFEIDASNGFTNDVAIDLLRVETCGQFCAAPLGLAVSNITSNSADFTYNDGNTVPSAGYEIVVVPAGDPAPTGAGDPESSNTYAITMLTPSTAYDAYVRADCGNGDFSVYAGPLNFSTNIQGPLGVSCPNMNPAFVFTEEFDTQGGWTGAIGTGNQQWRFGQSGGTGSTGTGPTMAGSGGAYVYYEASGAGTISAMVSPAIDLSTATDSAELSFLIHAFGANITNFNIGVGNTATGPFTQVFGITGQLQTANADPFQPAGVDLSAYLGQVIYLQFEIDATAGFTNDVAIDLLRVETCGSFCAAPLGLNVGAITATTAELSWTDGNTTPSAGFEYVIVPAGDPAPTGAGTATTANPQPLTGLTAVTSYDAYIRADCGNGDFSVYAGPFTFDTACAAVAPPYSEDFSNATFDMPGLCWTEAQNVGPAGPPNNTDGTWGTDDWNNDTASPNGTAMKINLWLASKEDWIVTPQFDLGPTPADYTLSFDLLINTFGSMNPGTLGSDDEVRVLASDDNGVTWTTLATYDNNYVASPGGDNILLNLSQVSGIYQFAFYATEGTVDDTEDNDVMIDNFNLDVTVGFEDETFTGFSFYPNPATDTINVSANSNMTSVSFTNMLGQQVQSTIVNDVNGSIDISGFAQGVYLMNVTMDGAQRSFRVIKE